MGAEEVKNKRLKDGLYEFSYKGHTVTVERRPDLYFDLPLEGKLYKGYLKDLKAMFAKWVDTGTGAPSTPSAAEPAEGEPAAEPEAIPVRREDVQRFTATAPIPQRSYPTSWIRKDKFTGKLSRCDGLTLFARLSHPAYEAKYPNPSEAMRRATQESPVSNDHAEYWPEVPVADKIV